MGSLKKNVAGQNVTFGLVSASTGGAATGASVTAYVTKDGTQALGTGTITELKVSSVGYGAYNYSPTQAETNATDVGFLFVATGAIPVNLDFHPDIVDANGYASVNVADFGGTAVTGRDLGASVLLSSGTGAGQISLASGLVALTAAEHAAISGTDVPAALTAQGYTTARAPKLDNLDAAVSTRSTYAGGAVASVTAGVTVGGYSTGQDPATLVLNAVQASYNTAGSIGNKIGAAASAGDPWSTSLPGSYGAGTAGNILGNELPKITSAIAAAQTSVAVVSATSSTSFIVSGLNNTAPAGYVGMQLEFSSTAGNPKMRQTITGATASGSNVALTFTAPFGVAPVANETATVF